MTKQNKKQNKTKKQEKQGVMDILKESVYSKIYEKTKNNRLAFREWCGACLFAMSQEEKPESALDKIKLILKKAVEDAGESWDSVRGAENKKLRYLKKLYEIRTQQIDASESPESIANYIESEGLSMSFVEEEHDAMFNPTKQEKPTKKDEGVALEKLVTQLERVLEDAVLTQALNKLLKEKSGFELVKNKQARLKALKEA